MNTYKIYLINFDDGFIYVGKTKNTLIHRLKQHKANLISGKSYKLYEHWKSIGIDPSIECLECNLSKEKAIQLEHDYTLAYMFLTDKILNENIGSNLSSKTKLKISESRKGKYCGNQNGFYGKTHSIKTKLKISNSNKGKLKGENNPMYGKTHTDEVKHILSMKAKENNQGEDNPMYGKHHSSDSKLKIKNSLGKPKEYYELNPTTRSSFKRTCSRYGWNFINFEETFHSYKIFKNNCKQAMYTYIFRGENYIRDIDYKTVLLKPLEYWETHSTRRHHFKRVCNDRQLLFSDFNEVLDETTKTKKYKKYFYFKINK